MRSYEKRIATRRIDDTLFLDHRLNLWSATTGSAEAGKNEGAQRAPQVSLRGLAVTYRAFLDDSDWAFWLEVR
jgi:hypothetical protein